MSKRRLFKKFREYDSNQTRKVKELSGLLGIRLEGRKTVEVPNRNGYVYVRLRNNQNELIQAFNEKVSPVFGLPVLLVYKNNRYEVVGRDSARYSDWGSFSSFLPRHGSQHSLNFANGQGGDITFVYSRQFMPFATIPSGTEGADTVFVMPHVFRNPSDATWEYIGDQSSPSFLGAKPTGTSARMMLLYWDLDVNAPLIVTGSFMDGSITGTAGVLPYVPTISNQNHVPLSAIRLVSGTRSLLWDNIYDMRQWASTTAPSPFNGGIAVWDEGIPVGTGTTLNFVGPNVQATISGSVVQVFVTGSSGGSSPFTGVDQIGVFGQDEGVPLGTGTILNVTGARATFTRSGTVLNLNISPDPIELIGIMGQDEGVPLGTGLVLNVTGDNIALSLSGTVLNLSHTNPAITFPQELIGIMGWDDGTPIGTGLVVDFGDNLTATRSGTVIRVDATSGGGGGGGSTLIYDDSQFVATGTKISFNENLNVVASGTSVFVSAPITTYFRVGQPVPLTTITGSFWQVPDQVYASGSLGVFQNGHVLVPGIDYEEQIFVSGTFRYIVNPATGTIHVVHYGVPCIPQTHIETGTAVSGLRDSDGVLLGDSDGVQLQDSEG